MERANVDNLLAACVGDALVSQSHYPEKDKSDPNKRYRIDAHTISSLFVTPKCLLDSPSLNKIDHENYQSNNQYDMDEPTHRVRSDQSQCPHDQENHKNSPKHVSPPFYFIDKPPCQISYPPNV